MTSKARRAPRKAIDGAEDVEALYLEFLRFFYQAGDREQAAKIAPRLEEALRSQPDVSRSIRGEEVRSLLAELRGDLVEAIRCRESEIRKILELHGLALNRPAWAYVVRQYDYGDVSDRLDLLAGLYAEQGDLEWAIKVLEESKQFCEAHNIPFDGQDLLDQFAQARVAANEGPQPAPESIDEAIKAAYLRLETPADELLIDDQLGRRFAEEVNRCLSPRASIPIKDVKRRLLALRRRGEAAGGLPRLRG
jgi:hypothetical protein